ncbi:Isoquinoline 1-oxidoreductase beta subunit [Paramagnetospirillum magnetotacticum MS-1]|uniref:Isoquinoline 1-oxidoreductase beta subunit n=1 Tax=Paramagnetospirillum magnetotacticum MS-1 TaxID=272627 RepID=A0A0C2UEK1_PARME|nr:molybdopterin cofactor-binding domain-containing protein [Paramagnetospirillum magnetotacticum]KIL99932.1 Isoquinoline 1-oxidoreductase beta subunit [Paramagnetospirillum magnetotacticum MS-1]
MSLHLSRRALLGSMAALSVAFALPRAARSAPRTNDPAEVDGFIAIGADGRVTIYCGKVDLGQGLRIAIRQMAAEELGIAAESITLIEGDTALTPDQGPTAGSTGVAKGGMQIRQAAATARQALISLAAPRLELAPEELDLLDGAVVSKTGGRSIALGDLIGESGFSLKLDPKAPLRRPAEYRVVGKPLPRPDIPAKVCGTHVYVHDFKLPGMLHGRVIRPPSVGAHLLRVDESSIRAVKSARVIRIKNFLAVVAGREWDAVRAARLLKAEWSESTNLIGHQTVRDWLKIPPFVSEEVLKTRGDASARLSGAPPAVEYYWPVQSHGSLGPSCAVAQVKDGAATIWTASQATHKFRPAFAALLGLPADKVRLIYLDGSGCYGMNGHDDAAADAALLAKVLGKPVRVAWSRDDELGWDPKGPPQLLSIRGAMASSGLLTGWSTEMWVPKATANLVNVPLLAPEAAGIDQPQGLITGLISQNGDPPYAVADLEVKVHWQAESPLRPSNIRAPGKIANVFAVESYFDELCAGQNLDPLVTRLIGLRDFRGIAVLTKAASMMAWAPRPSPNPKGDGTGRGIAYVHYKHSETYVAMAMEVAVERETGRIVVKRVTCAHDCGQVINPDALKMQIEGCILQTLSRTLLEEVTFDSERVTSTDQSTYPILGFGAVPDLTIELLDRPDQPPMGGGEAACTPVPAALANAVFDAVGVRLRTVPFTPERVKEALQAL